ncbi:MAG: 50S ribosomal protein L22 [Actinobacteria bacterium]|nr:MAG: 50S ribosomal protein L22 [Actinomycetota bacterium]
MEKEGAAAATAEAPAKAPGKRRRGAKADAGADQKVPELEAERSKDAPRAAARDWARLLDSAVANAENNHELVGDELRVTQAIADEGPTLKRYRPRAMGRATQIRKRTSHLTITLAPEEE